MALNYGAMFNLNASVTGTQSIDTFTGKLKQVGSTADTVNKQMAGLRGAMKALAGGFAATQLAGFVTELARTTIQLDAYSKQLSISFGARSTIELETLRNTMRSLGIAQDEALGSAVRFTAAMKLSGQSTEEANRSFADASKLILSNKLSADGAQRVFYAMSQIASKGKLMSEELNGQLGDTLAGFTQQVAAAMNKSTAQLMKDMQNGTVSAEQFFKALNKIGDGIDPASLNSAAKSLGDLKNAWFDFKSSVIAVDTIKAVLDGTTIAIKFLSQNGAELMQVAVGIAAGVAGFMAMSAIVPILVAAAEAIVFLTLATAAFGVAEVATMIATDGLAASLAVLNAVGGPITIALAAVAGAIALFAYTSAKADEKAKKFGKSIEELNARINENKKWLPQVAGDVKTLGGNMGDETPKVTKFAGEVGAVADQLYRLALANKEARKQALLTDIFEAQKLAMSAQSDLNKQKNFDATMSNIGSGFLLAGNPTMPMPANTQSKDYLDKLQKVNAANRVAADAQRQLATLNEMTLEQQVTAEDRTRIKGQTATSTTQKDDPFLSALGSMKGNAAQLIAEIGAWDKYDIKIKGSQKALAMFETADPLGKFFKESEVRKLAFVAEGKNLDELKKTTDGLRAYQSSSESLGGKEAELKFKIAYFNEYGESTRSANSALLDFEIAEGKYYGRTADEISALRSKAQAVDTLTDSVRRQQALIRDARDLEIAKVSNQQEIAALRDEPLALTMSAFAYQQLTERKQELAKITEEALKKEPENRQAYTDEQIAALNLRQEIERVNEAKRQSIAGGTAAALTSYGDEIAKLGDHVASAWQNALKGTEDALVNFAMTGKLSFKELASSIVADLMRIAIQQSIMLPITLALRTAGLPFANGGAFSGGNQVSVNANGNAFGSQGVMAFANGGVVNRPTMFRHGGGLGVMGEAGPEAIMPLRRLGNGRLGVETTGAGGGTQIVEVNVSVEGGGSQVNGDPGKANELGKLVANAVRVELVQQKRPGGLLAA
jgi:lambda family phage tail tape measure protein